MEITVTLKEALEECTRQNLEEHAMYLLKEGNDKHEFIGEKAALFASFCKVIKYYSTREEFELFIAKTKGKKVE